LTCETSIDQHTKEDTMVHTTPHARTLDQMWEKRQDCISCEGVSPVCNCAANEQCILTGRYVLPPARVHKLMTRSCTQCAQIECIPNPSSSKGKSINPGVIAGPVVAALIILGVAALWWLRRKRVCPPTRTFIQKANLVEKGSSKSRGTRRTST